MQLSIGSMFVVFPADHVKSGLAPAGEGGPLPQGLVKSLYTPTSFSFIFLFLFFLFFCLFSALFLRPVLCSYVVCRITADIGDLEVHEGTVS